MSDRMGRTDEGAGEPAPAMSIEGADETCSFCGLAREGVFHVSASGRFVYANAATARIFGYASPTELMAGVRNVDALHVEPGRRDEFVRRINESGQVVGFKSRVRRLDGEIVWISEDANLLRGDDGSVLGFMGIVRDVTEKTLAERAVFEAEETWPSLVERASDCLLVSDRGGVLSFVSPRAGDVLRVGVGDRISKLVSPESRECLEKAVASVAEHGDVELLELAGNSGGDPQRWIEFRLMPVWRGGANRKTVAIVTDVSDRRRAEEELQASRRFSERLADALPAVLYVFELSGRRFTYVNDQSQSILGYRADEWLAMDWRRFAEIVHPDDLPLMGERIRQLSSATEGTVYECDYRLKHLCGEWRSVRVRETVFRIGAGGIPEEILGMVYDISDQVGMRGEIRKSEAQFRALVESTQAVPWEYDPIAEVFTYVGPQAEQLLGLPVANWYEPGFWLDRVHPEDREKARAARDFDTLPAAGAQCEYRVAAADGHIVWVQDTVHSDREEGERGRLLRGFSLDTTEPRRAQKEREAANRQLRALSERLETAREEERAHLAREFHDQLGQELTGLKMDLRWIAGRASQAGGDDAGVELQMRTDDMGKAIDRMIHTVRTIATSLRPAVLDECGLGMAIEWQAGEFERRSGIRCAVVNKWTREFEDADMATALFRIFQEILTNVARHSEADKVTVLLKSDRKDDIMEVADNGRGITPSEISRSIGILGMRERANAFGGKLEIKGSRGAGTKVRIRLPRAAPKRSADLSGTAQRLAWLLPLRGEK